jgi:hypothetical protein
MYREVTADLLAKIVVSKRAEGNSFEAPPSRGFGFTNIVFQEYIDLITLCAYPLNSEGILFAPTPEFILTLERGWFEKKFEFGEESFELSVAVIPIGLFAFEPEKLRWVGAGDTSSAVSFVFSLY